MSGEDESIEQSGQPATPPATSRSGRRDVLKKGAVAAGVAGATWVAPRVEGLSLRPDYAAAQSPGVSNPISFTVPAFSGNANVNAPVSPSGSVSLDITQNGGPLTITRDAGACAFSSIDAISSPDANFNAGPVITPDQITGTINAPDQPFQMSITMICT